MIFMNHLKYCIVSGGIWINEVLTPLSSSDWKTGDSSHFTPHHSRIVIRILTVAGCRIG